MAWTLNQDNNYQVFARNPLVLSILQLRYHPILRISDGEIAEFQNRVREIFPLYALVKPQIVNIQPGQKDEVDVREETHHHFIKEDHSAKLVLTNTFLNLENHNHTSYTDTISDLTNAIQALEELYSPIKTTRLGLRYINVINKRQISSDLGTQVELGDLINKEFLSFPSNIADIDNTFYIDEIDAPCESSGRMSLRYGIVREDSDNFRLDIDRYCESKIEIKQIRELIEIFALDIYSIFCIAANTRLKDWMKN